VNQTDGRYQVVTATHEDEEQLAEMIAGALVAAELLYLSYLMPDEDQQHVVLARMLRLDLENVRERAGIVRTIAGREAVALWTYHRGSDEPETELDARREKAAGESAARCLAFHQVLEARRRDLLGSQPHWHLRIIAARPDQQGLGLGSLLIRDQLSIIDRVGEATYVEAPTEELRRTFQKLGFRPHDPPIVLGEGRTRMFPALHWPTPR
jgi:GNAT superfamily N-acetyltransferase